MKWLRKTLLYSAQYIYSIQGWFVKIIYSFNRSYVKKSCCHDCHKINFLKNDLNLRNRKRNLICLLDVLRWPHLTIPKRFQVLHKYRTIPRERETGQKIFSAKTSDKLMIDAERCLQVESESLWSSIRTSLAQQGALKSVFTCQNYVAFLEEKKIRKKFLNTKISSHPKDGEIIIFKRFRRWFPQCRKKPLNEKIIFFLERVN